MWLTLMQSGLAEKQDTCGVQGLSIVARVCGAGSMDTCILYNYIVYCILYIVQLHCTITLYNYIVQLHCTLYNELYTGQRLLLHAPPVCLPIALHQFEMKCNLSQCHAMHLSHILYSCKKTNKRHSLLLLWYFGLTLEHACTKN